MKIDRISYQRTYNLGSYNSEKIGLEATIDEGEDIQFAMCNLKHQCDEIHKKNNPNLYQETTPIPIKKEFIISVSGDNISADVSIKTQDDFLALDGLIDTVKREV